MLKRIICKLTAFAVVAVSIASMALPASADTNTQTYSGSISTTKKTMYGSKSTMYAWPGYTKIEANDSDYSGSWKHADFYVYGKSGGSYYRIAGGFNDGSGNPVTKTLSYDSSAVARRYHSAYINLTSNAFSDIVDDLTIIINKS